MMASIPTPTPRHNLTFPSPRFPSLKRPFYPPSRFPDSTLCRCSNNPSDSNSSSSINWRWDSAIQDVIKNAIKRFESYMNPFRKDSSSTKGALNDGVSDERRRQRGQEDDWDWDRWKKHFEQVDEQERLLSLLKSQLNEAVSREDYEDAARLKVAIAAAATNDTVGRVISHLNRAVVEERFHDAAFLRDNAGAGLVGWWAGLSDDTKDPYGLIIRVTAEHGRYVARSFSPRQLASASVGVPLFEIFLTVNKKGEYKQQAVYLKRRSVFQDSSMVSSKTSGATSRSGPSGSSEDNNDIFVVSTEDDEDGDDEDDDDADDGSDVGEGLTGFQNILRDMIPGVKVKVMKVTMPGKVDRDFISKVIEQIIEDEDEEKDAEIESVELDDEIKSESDQERDQIEINADSGVIDNDMRGEIAVKVVVGGLAQKLSGSVPATESLRVPAKLVKKGRLTFSFSIENDINLQDSSPGTRGSMDRKEKIQNQRSIDNIMFDLAKFVGKEKIPLKVLKDVGELINLTLSQAQNHQPLSGSTTFHRIEIAASPDPLNGLYIGAHGLYTSEVIHLRRKFGQWQDSGTKEPSDLEFYEYVEAVKLTGDPYVPAGQVAFRARVGKSYQLPHKGIIPEEFGVVARYKGQGRLAEPGFRNPRWVDGELVILDGKYIKGGPVVGFVYWAPEYHFLVFFNRLRLQP
ncbi:PREDICTED: protein EXECUTER 1, chloroplastic [Theobroma cacao]|uniref:Protein EXECUTER 1, chloroplastic n=1 Tax=Theobroma cacao TaxID=3641 RepID=A0AB32VZ09_THECC|nr:PREDICTED: protein EXECUTER 1, chloroplastic [Theobroma cacao]